MINLSIWSAKIRLIKNYNLSLNMIWHDIVRIPQI